MHSVQKHHEQYSNKHICVWLISLWFNDWMCAFWIPIVWIPSSYSAWWIPTAVMDTDFAIPRFTTFPISGHQNWWGLLTVNMSKYVILNAWACMNCFSHGSEWCKMPPFQNRSQAIVGLLSPQNRGKCSLRSRDLSFGTSLPRTFLNHIIDRATWFQTLGGRGTWFKGPPYWIPGKRENYHNSAVIQYVHHKTTCCTNIWWTLDKTKKAWQKNTHFEKSKMAAGSHIENWGSVIPGSTNL